MTVAEILQSVKLVVDHNGKPTAALLDMDAWEAFIAKLEDIEDAELVRARIANWRDKQGWTRWEDFEVELGVDELSTLGQQ